MNTTLFELLFWYSNVFFVLFNVCRKKHVQSLRKLNGSREGSCFVSLDILGL